MNVYRREWTYYRWLQVRIYWKFFTSPKKYSKSVSWAENLNRLLTVMLRIEIWNIFLEKQKSSSTLVWLKATFIKIINLYILYVSCSPNPTTNSETTRKFQKLWTNQNKLHYCTFVYLLLLFRQSNLNFDWLYNSLKSRICRFRICLIPFYVIYPVNFTFF